MIRTELTRRVVSDSGSTGVDGAGGGVSATAIAAPPAAAAESAAPEWVPAGARAADAVGGVACGSARWQAAATAQIEAKARPEASRVGWASSMSAREVYQKTKKLPDLFWNRFVCRPLAAVLVDAVKDTGITPNQITLLSCVVGFASAALLVALPGHSGLIAAVFVYQLSYVLDCADGMLARWRGLASPAGHLLDFLMDELKAFAVLAAAAVRLHLQYPEQPFLLLGLGGLVALASGIALTSFQRHPAIAPPSRAAEPPRGLLARALRLLESGAKFLIHYPSYILYVALAGRLELYLYPYVAVNVLYAARTWLSVALRFGRA